MTTCKHCGERIEPYPNGLAWFHPDNVRGKNTCQIEPYGLHAAPHDVACTNPCIAA